MENSRSEYSLWVKADCLPTAVTKRPQQSPTAFQPGQSAGLGTPGGTASLSWKRVLWKEGLREELSIRIRSTPTTHQGAFHLKVRLPTPTHSTLVPLPPQTLLLGSWETWDSQEKGGWRVGVQVPMGQMYLHVFAPCSRDSSVPAPDDPARAEVAGDKSSGTGAAQREGLGPPRGDLMEGSHSASSGHLAGPPEAGLRLHGAGAWGERSGPRCTACGLGDTCAHRPALPPAQPSRPSPHPQEWLGCPTAGHPATGCFLGRAVDSPASPQSPRRRP